MSMIASLNLIAQFAVCWLSYKSERCTFLAINARVYTISGLVCQLTTMSQIIIFPHTHILLAPRLLIDKVSSREVPHVNFSVSDMTYMNALSTPGYFQMHLNLIFFVIHQSFDAVIGIKAFTITSELNLLQHRNM